MKNILTINDLNCAGYPNFICVALETDVGMQAKLTLARERFLPRAKKICHDLKVLKDGMVDVAIVRISTFPPSCV